MTKKSQSGFTLVETLLVILIITIIGFGGYYVWQNQTEKSTDTKSTAQAPKRSEMPESDQSVDDISSDWTLFQVPNGSASIRLADGLQFVASEDKTSLIDYNEVNYIAGVPAKIEVIPHGSDNPIGLFMCFTCDVYIDERSDKQESLTTKTGVVVEKYFFEQTIEPDSLDYPKGAKAYEYVAKKNGKTVTIRYSFMGTGVLEIVEKMIKTLEVK